MAKEAISVYVTGADRKTLEKLIFGLRCNPGFHMGVSVIPKGDGKFRVEEHNGEITHNSSNVRVVEGQVWTDKGAELIRGALENDRVSHTRYKGKVAVEILQSRDPEPLDEVTDKLRKDYEITYFHS